MLWKHSLEVCAAHWRRTRAQRWRHKWQHLQNHPFEDHQVLQHLEQLQEPMQQFLEKIPPGLEVRLYGSFVRGRLRPDSDLDLILQTPSRILRQWALQALDRPPQGLSVYLLPWRWQALELRLCGPTLAPPPQLAQGYLEQLTRLGATVEDRQILTPPAFHWETHFLSEPLFRLQGKFRQWLWLGRGPVQPV